MEVSITPLGRVGATQRRFCLREKVTLALVEVTYCQLLRGVCVVAALAFAAPRTLASECVSPPIALAPPSSLAPPIAFTPANIDAGLTLGGEQESAPSVPAIEVAPETHARFGAENSWRWQLLGGFMSDLEGDSQYQFGASLSWFFHEGISMDFQVEGDYIAQSGGDAWGGTGTLLFRWHFVNEETWSLYADLGCGLIGTSAPVPAGGGSVNFTPQAGGGVSFAITPEVRLMLGVRWFHISNANTGETNPGRNSAMAYAMLSFPF
jgi:opacity protein-like surface antigen